MTTIASFHQNDEAEREMFISKIWARQRETAMICRAAAFLAVASWVRRAFVSAHTVHLRKEDLVSLHLASLGRTLPNCRHLTVRVTPARLPLTKRQTGKQQSMHKRQFIAILAAAGSPPQPDPTVSAARADTLSDITSSKTVRIAIPQDFPPFGSVGIDMKPQGYDIGMAALIAKKLGANLEMVP